MTRVNTILPCYLADTHLVAEWREIIRIPNAIASGKAVVDILSIPDNFLLGTGHVRFFYNKLRYIQYRHDLICKEMDKRGINRDKQLIVSLDNCPKILCNDWLPSIEDKILSSKRILERYDDRKKRYTYKGLTIETRDEMIELLDRACSGEFKKQLEEWG